MLFQSTDTVLQNFNSMQVDQNFHKQESWRGNSAKAIIH